MPIILGGVKVYCVIQEIELKKENEYGYRKELEAYKSTWVINGIEGWCYLYTMTGERFKRPIKKAYKISIHKSYREKGKVKKKQWSICTMSYYSIAEGETWIGNYFTTEGLKEKLRDIGITEEELERLVYIKLDSLIDKIQKDYKETEEYKTHKMHNDMINKYQKEKSKFDKVYGEGSYDKCYDVFGDLREKEKLEEIKRVYENSKTYQSSYRDNYRSSYNYSNSNSSYHSNEESNYNEVDRDKYKKIYKTLAKAYHPDIIKDDGEMMKLVNKLKEEWRI